MRMYDIIEKKKAGKILTKEEISWFVDSLSGRIPDYQITAFLMAVYFQGMEEQELTDFTLAMAQSGDMADLSGISGFKADKHSTGGVGDKTTLIAAPIAAALNVKVAKMSGRGLGFTGGTIDKLESIDGYRTTLGSEEFFSVVNRYGMALIGQSGNLAPADKKLYALRDVTATVDSIPLIAASIMSKKLASGSDGIVLDVKMGSGAFMKTKEQAIQLARTMISIGRRAGKRMAALITNMDEPLGYAVGNVLEVKEAVCVLKGEGPEDVKELSLELAAHMAALSGEKDIETCRKEAKHVLEDGSAYQCFRSVVKAQGGNDELLEHPELFGRAEYEYEYIAGQSGYITDMDTQKIGNASMTLGAGRERADAGIDPLAGIVFEKKTGDYVETGERIAMLFSMSCYGFSEAERLLREAILIKKEKTEKKPLIYQVFAEKSVQENPVNYL